MPVSCSDDQERNVKIAFTVGKIEEGVAVLVTDELQMIEFPSEYLPADCGSIKVGSVIRLQIEHEEDIEEERLVEFKRLQQDILQKYSKPPNPDVIGGCLRLEAVSQEFLLLEWPSWRTLVETHGWTAKLKSLDCLVNGSLAFYGIGEQESLIRLTGLEAEKSFAIQLVFRTSAGSFPSNVVQVKTLSPTDFTGLFLFIDKSIGDDLVQEISQTAYSLAMNVLDQLDMNKATHLIGCQANQSSDIYRQCREAGVPTVDKGWIEECVATKSIAKAENFKLK